LHHTRGGQCPAKLKIEVRQPGSSVIRLMRLDPDTTFFQLNLRIACAYHWAEVPEDYYFEIDRSFALSPLSQLTINGGAGGIPCLYDASTSLITEALGYFIERTVKYRRLGDTLTYEVNIVWIQEEGLLEAGVQEARVQEARGLAMSLRRLGWRS
jgi:hypothetical protein